MSVVSEILSVCSTIKFERTVHTVYRHLESEIDELAVEIYCTDDKGEDGVIGEAVDVMLCAIDIMYKDSPNITEDEISKVVQRKLAKWQRVYGEE
ncbi:hypothetical protein D3C75_603590 [compost metagenome]